MSRASVLQALIDAGEIDLAAAVSCRSADDADFNLTIPPDKLVDYWRRVTKSGTPFDYVAAFLRKLNDHGINNISGPVERRLMAHFGDRMRTAAQPSVASDVALSVYQDAKMLPGTETKVSMKEDLNLSINGPIFEGRSLLLSAVDLTTGVLLAIKVLPGHEHHFRRAATSEKQAVTLLGLDKLEVDESSGTPLVPSKLIEVYVGDTASAIAVGVAQGRHHEALKMPLLASSLARLPQLSEKLICAGGRRLQQALVRVHDADLVHCDVKADNVMVSSSGLFFLTDFGSSVKTGKKIESCTECWYPEPMLFKPAHPEHDWGMLLVLLAVELRKSAFNELLDIPVGKVLKKAVLDRCTQVGDAELKVLMEELIKSAGWDADK